MFVPSNEKRDGIQITKVMKGGLAERYGLKDNDIILKVNNSEVNFQSDLQNLLFPCTFFGCNHYSD